MHCTQERRGTRIRGSDQGVVDGWVREEVLLLAFEGHLRQEDESLLLQRVGEGRDVAQSLVSVLARQQARVVQTVALRQSLLTVSCTSASHESGDIPS